MSERFSSDKFPVGFEKNGFSLKVRKATLEDRELTSSNTTEMYDICYGKSVLVSCCSFPNIDVCGSFLYIGSDFLQRLVVYFTNIEVSKGRIRTVEFRPDHMPDLYRLGDLFYRMKKFDKVEDYSKCLVNIHSGIHSYDPLSEKGRDLTKFSRKYQKLINQLVRGTLNSEFENIPKDVIECKVIPFIREIDLFIKEDLRMVVEAEKWQKCDLSRVKIGAMGAKEELLKHLLDFSRPARLYRSITIIRRGFHDNSSVLEHICEESSLHCVTEVDYMKLLTTPRKLKKELIDIFDRIITSDQVNEFYLLRKLQTEVFRFCIFLNGDMELVDISPVMKYIDVMISNYLKYGFFPLEICNSVIRTIKVYGNSSTCLGLFKERTKELWDLVLRVGDVYGKCCNRENIDDFQVDEYFFKILSSRINTFSRKHGFGNERFDETKCEELFGGGLEALIRFLSYFMYLGRAFRDKSIKQLTLLFSKLHNDDRIFGYVYQRRHLLVPHRESDRHGQEYFPFGYLPAVVGIIRSEFKRRRAEEEEEEEGEISMSSYEQIYDLGGLVREFFVNHVISGRISLLGSKYLSSTPSLFVKSLSEVLEVVSIIHECEKKLGMEIQNDEDPKRSFLKHIREKKRFGNREIVFSIRHCNERSKFGIKSWISIFRHFRLLLKYEIDDEEQLRAISYDRLAGFGFEKRKGVADEEDEKMRRTMDVREMMVYVLVSFVEKWEKYSTVDTIDVKDFVEVWKHVLLLYQYLVDILTSKRIGGKECKVKQDGCLEKLNKKKVKEIIDIIQSSTTTSEREEDESIERKRFGYYLSRFENLLERKKKESFEYHSLINFFLYEFPLVPKTSRSEGLRRLGRIMILLLEENHSNVQINGFIARNIELIIFERESELEKLLERLIREDVASYNSWRPKSYLSLVITKNYPSLCPSLLSSLYKPSVKMASMKGMESSYIVEFLSNVHIRNYEGVIRDFLKTKHSILTLGNNNAELVEKISSMDRMVSFSDQLDLWIHFMNENVLKSEACKIYEIVVISAICKQTKHEEIIEFVCSKLDFFLTYFERNIRNGVESKFGESEIFLTLFEFLANRNEGFFRSILDKLDVPQLMMSKRLHRFVMIVLKYFLKKKEENNNNDDDDKRAKREEENEISEDSDMKTYEKKMLDEFERIYTQEHVSLEIYHCEFEEFEGMMKKFGIDMGFGDWKMEDGLENIPSEKTDDHGEKEVEEEPFSLEGGFGDFSLESKHQPQPRQKEDEVDDQFVFDFGELDLGTTASGNLNGPEINRNSEVKEEGKDDIFFF